MIYHTNGREVFRVATPDGLAPTVPGLPGIHDPVQAGGSLHLVRNRQSGMYGWCVHYENSNTGGGTYTLLSVPGGEITLLAAYFDAEGAEAAEASVDSVFETVEVDYSSFTLSEADGAPIDALQVLALLNRWRPLV